MGEKCYFKSMKGIAIILVVLQHVMAQIGGAAFGSIPRVFYCVDIEVFYFISGYLFQNNVDKYIKLGTASFVKKKSKEILFPYLFWNFLIHGLVVLGCKIPATEKLFTSIGWQPLGLFEICVNVMTFSNYYMEMLWFLYVLYICFLFNYIFAKKINHKLLFGTSIFALSVLAAVVGNTFIFRKLGWGMICFAAGRILHGFEWEKFISRISAAVAATAVFVLAFFAEKNLNPMVASFLLLYQTFSYAECVLYTVSSVTGVMFVCRWIKKHSRVINALLEKLGDMSMYIYLLHNPFLIFPLIIVIQPMINCDWAVCLITAYMSICAVSMLYQVSGKVKWTKLLFGGR